jgi:hypothetical protein
MPEYKLDFPVNVGSPAPIKSLSDAVREVGDRTKASQGDLSLFKSLLEADAKAGVSLVKSIDDIKRSTDSLTPGVRNLAGELQKLTQAQAQVQAQSQKTAQAIEQNYTKAAGSANRELLNLSRTLSGISGAGLPGGSAPIQGLLGGAGTIGMIGGITAAISAAGLGIFSLVKSAGEGARDLANFSSRLGLTADQAQKLSIAARITGVNIGSLEQSARLLGQALDDPTGAGKKQIEVLGKLGVATRETSGDTREMGQVLVDVLQRLAQIPNVAERVHESQLLLGRGSKELQPLIEDLPRLTKSADELAQSLKTGTNSELLRANEEINKLDEAWEIFKKNVAAGLAPVTISVLTNLSQDLQPGQRRGPQGLRADSGADAGGGDGFFTHDTIPLATGAPSGKQTAGLTASLLAATSAHAKDLAAADSLSKKLQGDFDKTKDGLQALIEKEHQAAEKARENATASGTSFAYRQGQQKLMNEALQKELQLRAQLKSLDSQGHGMSQGEWRTQFLNRGNPSELGRQLQEARDQTTARIREHPEERTADLQALSQRLVDILNESLKKAGEQSSKIENEQAETRLKIEASITEEYEKRLRNPSPTLTQSLGFVQQINAPIPQTPAQLAAAQRQRLALGQTVNSGILARERASGNLSPQQLAGMELTDQLAYITQSRNVDVNEFSSQASGFRTQAGNESDPRKALEYLIQAADADVKAEERKTAANIQATEAINKFQLAAEEASAKLREDFGNLISGLAAAGREGHAGTYARNYMLGQSDKIIGNFASSMYRPGLFEFPGQGTPQNPTPLAKMFQGTMFGMDPKAHQSDQLATVNDALKSTTDQNTKATVDNTTVMAAVYQALGGDPTSLGLSNLPAMPSLTGGSSTAALPFLGAAGAAGASSAAAIVSTSLKAAGISVPGLTSGGDSLTPSNAVTGLFKMMTGGGSSPTLSTGAGIFGPTDSNGMPIIPGVTSGPATDNWSSMAGDLDQLANGGNGNPGLTSSMSALTKAGTLMNGPLPSDSELANAGSSSSSIFTASNPLTNLFNVNGTASPGQQVGAGLQVGGEAFGAYKGVTQAFKGGAQNIMGGIGETAMSIAPLLGPAAPFVEAGGAVLSLVSSLMGDPRANRQASINHELFNNQYIAPQAINRTMDISGGYAEENFQGNVRGTDLSSLPVLQQAYPDPRHGVIVPGTVLSPFGGGGSPSVTSVGNFGGLTTTSGSGGHTINVTNNVSAIDGDSVAQFFQNNAQALGDGIVHAINTGGSDMANRLRTL